MKNRIASLFLAFALMMSLCTLAVARDNPIAVQSGGAERFTDVPASHWAYSYIDKVVGSGLFNGKTPTTFEPSSAMTRSQFVMVMARMEGMSSLEGQYTTTKFPDVTPTRRAAGPIAWASAEEQGFVLGFGDGTFKPDSPITRGQFAALIHRYIVAKRYTNLLVVDPEPAQFTDVGSVSPAFTADVEYARVHGLLTGYSDGTVRASNPITRAAIAAILARFLDLVTESGYIPLMDGPDSGNSGGNDNPPVETPTDYKDIKLVVKRGEYGKTSIVSVLRNGVQVAHDDVQKGDVVTVSHEPDSGYVVSIRVKDSKGKSVKPITTKGNLSTFTLPANLPVTITVTYTKQSGGGGGGGGGSSGGGDYTESTYYANIKAVFDPANGGKVYLTTKKPAADGVVDTSRGDGSPDGISFTRVNNKNINVYAVFVPDDPNATYISTDKPENATINVPEENPLTMYLTKNDQTAKTNAVKATYVRVTAEGTTSKSKAPNVTVTAHFNTGTTPQPTKTWTVTVDTNNSEGAYFNVATTQQTEAVTAATEATSLNFNTVTKASESVYVAVTPQAGYEFGTTATLTASDNSTVELLPGGTDTLRVYKITKNDFADGANTTNVTMKLSKKGEPEPGPSTDDKLDYSLRVKIVGNGSATLRVGNKTQTVSADTTISGSMTKSEFDSLYPQRAQNYRLPVYLTGKPVASKGYKYDDGNAKYDGNTDVKVIPAGTNAADLTPAYFLLDADTTNHEVTITFTEIVSYGYNLTVIGDGTVTVDFNGTKDYPGNKDGTPKTYTSGLIVDAPASLTINKPNVAATLEAENPVVNGAEKAYGTISLDKNALTDIVVEIHKKDRDVYAFTVKVTNDVPDKEVTVKPESGKIANSFNASDKTLTSPFSSDIVVSGGSKTYYGYEDTVITIVPKTTDTVKVKSIRVTNPSELSDIMTTAGFSFQLKAAQTDAVVTFGTLDAYSVLVKAPYNSNGLSSRSTEIAPGTKVQNVLYSLNDGTRLEATTNPNTKVKNELGLTPSHLNKILEYYLTNPVATQKGTNQKVPGKTALEDMLKEAIQPNITTIVPAVVEAQKSTLDVKTPLKNAMEAKQASSTVVETLTGDARTAAIDAMLTPGSVLAQQINAGTIKREDIEVKVKVTPILSAATETQYAGLDLAGKSAQTQLEGFAADFLSKVRVKSGYENALTPNVNVDVKDINGVAQITVRATVATTGGWPELDNNVTMASYVDQLEVWAVVQVDSVTVNGQNLTPNPLPAPTLERASGDDVKNTIRTEMANVDSNISTTWRTEFNKLLENGELRIDMGTVLTKELLDQVVESMLQAPMNTVTGKIGSLGDGAATRSAFMNLYRDFVVVNNGNPDSLLTLKTRNEADKSFVIGAVKDKDLVLTIDFEKILRDTHYVNETPANADMVPYEKLADLVIALRDGISEDIRTNATGGQTSQSVIASMIASQMSANRGTLKAVKWGTEKTNWSETERLEISNLLAELVMNSDLDQSMQAVWQKLEDSGYRSVEYSVAVDASKRASVGGVIQSFYGGLGQGNQTTLDVGFKVEQGLK